MNIERALIGCALVLGTVLAQAAHHEADGKNGFQAVTTAKCSDIEFGAVVTDRFPEAAAACRGVVRDKAGTAYVEIAAVVHHTRRDPRTQAVNNVTFDMLDPAGAVLRKISIRPPRGFRFEVDGKQYDADYLTRGVELTLFLPADRWEVVWSPETATPVDTQVFIEDIDTFLVTTALEADEAFEFDSAVLSDTGRSELDAIIEVGGEYVPAITIFGYTDRIGDEKYNLDLSQRRADAAKAYLVGQGVPDYRITAVGRGEENPVVECEGEKGASLKECLSPNRRAEILFLVPAVADDSTIQVTKTYVKPLGETVTITEEKRVTRLAETSKEATQFFEACSVEIETLCSGMVPGSGRVLGCLAANRQPEYGYSPACDSTLAGMLDTVLFRRARLNAVGAACSAELAACDATPIGSKLQCVATGSTSEGCAVAMGNLVDFDY